MNDRHSLVTGANRGLGLELARQLLARGDRVVATARHPGRATALNTLAGIVVYALLVTLLWSVGSDARLILRNASSFDRHRTSASPMVAPVPPTLTKVVKNPLAVT